MAAYSRNAVYTRIRAAVLAVNSNAYVSGTYTPTPAKFPAVFARQIGKVQPVENVTLTHDDNQWRDTVEVQVFSDKAGGASSQAYKIMDAVEVEMKTLGYILDMMNPVDNIETTIFRLVARWHRVTGGADTMPSNT